MTDIGIVGLDTSHGEAFAAVLSRLQATDVPEAAPSVTAVWDGTTVRDDAYVAEFCEEFEATRYDDPTGMVTDVDAALVLSVDWERHVPLTIPFLEAGVPTLVDKPIAGTMAALERLECAASDTPLFGGSALPYHPSVSARADADGRRTLHLAGYHDYFYYRVHIVDAVRRLVDSAWTRVAPIDASAASGVEVSFDDGTWATLRFDGSTDDATFGILDVADRTRAVSVQSSRSTLQEMYEPYLDAFVRMVHGAIRPRTDGVLDAARLLLAVEAALSGDGPVTPGDSALGEIERPSGSFLEDYEPYY